MQISPGLEKYLSLKELRSHHKARRIGMKLPNLRQDFIKLKICLLCILLSVPERESKEVKTRALTYVPLSSCRKGRKGPWKHRGELSGVLWGPASPSPGLFLVAKEICSQHEAGPSSGSLNPQDPVGEEEAGVRPVGAGGATGRFPEAAGGERTTVFQITGSQ